MKINIKIKKNKKELVLYSFLFSLIFFILFGLVTKLIPNSIFIRMSTITFLDYLLFISTSILLGIYFSLWCLKKKMSTKCAITMSSGGIAGFIGFGCAFCNKILIFLIGITSIGLYIEPYRPIIGFSGIILLSYIIYKEIKTIKF